MTDDDKLKRAFKALEREDARKAPTFDAIVQRPRRRRSPWGIVAPLASVAVAAAAMLVLWSGPSSRSSAPAPMAARSQASDLALGGSDGVAAVPVSDPAPLDFLLDLPGSSALAATTSFDAKVFR